MKYLTRWVASWNQDCREKYQQPQTCRWYHPDGRKQRGKRNLMNVEEQSEKSGLNSAFKNVRSWYQFMANRWEKNETSDRLYFPGLLNLCGRWLQPWIKRCLFFGRKVTTNLDSVLKSRDITLLTKIHIIRPMVFPVVKYGCENWTIKRAECWRIGTFEPWC